MSETSHVNVCSVYVSSSNIALICIWAIFFMKVSFNRYKTNHTLTICAKCCLIWFNGYKEKYKNRLNWKCTSMIIWMDDTPF